MGSVSMGLSPMGAAIAERAGKSGAIDVRSGWPLAATFESMLDLSTEYGDTVLPESVIRAVADSLYKGETHYTDRPGLPALRQRVAKKLSDEQNVTVDPGSEVVISCGGREGIYLALQVMVQPGDEVLVPDPRPDFLAESIRLARGVMVPFALRADDGFTIRAEQIRERLTSRSKVLVLINPSNPTGSITPPEELAKVAALAAQHDLKILADETLDEAVSGDARHTSIASFPEAAGRTVIIGSLSRFYGLSSWRVGYFAGPKGAVTTIRDMKQAMTICTSAMSQYAALAMLTDSVDWLAQRRNRLDAARRLVLQSLDEMGLPHSHPHASPYIFVDIRSTRRTSEDFSEWLRSRLQIAVEPGTRFGEGGQGFVRLSLWPATSDLEQAMRRMKWAQDQMVGGER